jgi:hypothetical protein
VTASRRRPKDSYAPPATYASYAVRPPEQPGKRPPDRKENEVRRMLETPHPPAPSDLAERAMTKGRRLLRRRRVRRTLSWLLLLAVVAAAAVAAVAYRHGPQPADVTPPLLGR